MSRLNPPIQRLKLESASACVRASLRQALSIEMQHLRKWEEKEEQEAEPPIFGSDGVTDVTLELMTSREWIELGSQILVMPGGGHGLYYGSERGEKGVAGLEGFVGKVIEVVD